MSGPGGLGRTPRPLTQVRATCARSPAC